MVIGESCIVPKSDVTDFNYSISNITVIEIAAGSSSVQTKYTISNSNSQVSVNVYKFNCGRQEQKTISITADELNQILTTLKKYKVQKWNNFNKANHSEGAHGFSLKINGKDGKFIEAHGDGQYPADYDKFETEMYNCLTRLFAIHKTEQKLNI